MSHHQPMCRDAQAPDGSAAYVVASHPKQGWSLLCNGVVLFDDAGNCSLMATVRTPSAAPCPRPA
jgi:hypothetical protein